LYWFPVLISNCPPAFIFQSPLLKSDISHGQTKKFWLPVKTRLWDVAMVTGAGYFVFIDTIRIPIFSFCGFRGKHRPAMSIAGIFMGNRLPAHSV
jgi:hypothetical protein